MLYDRHGKTNKVIYQFKIFGEKHHYMYSFEKKNTKSKIETQFFTLDKLSSLTNKHVSNMAEFFSHKITPIIIIFKSLYELY